MEEKQADTPIKSFSPHLFWDTDKEKLDMDAHAAYIIKQVLEYGQINDWHLIRDYYTIPVIAQKAMQFRELEKKRCLLFRLFPIRQ